jgi:hypothetical protein
MTMQTENIVLDRGKARELYRKYRAHQHYSTPVDDEIRRCYQLIAQGRLVIKALESIVAAGVGADGYPKLAIVRADAESCFLQYEGDGSARFSSEAWLQIKAARNKYIHFPAGSFPAPPHRGRTWSRVQAITPLIPIDLRPKRGLENYHILFEAIWRPAPPVDPMLLRRIGEADLWVVVAAWDLTEVERGALAARIR